MSLAPRPTYLAPTGSVGLGSKLAGGLSAPRPNRISLKDDRFTLIMESGQQHPNVQPALSMQVIFVGGNSHASRVFYDSDAYDTDNPDAPVCWSDNGVGPSDKSSQPQSPTCGQCPKSVWGSAISKMTGAKIPACNTRKKVAVMVAGAGDAVFLLDIPPGSLKSFGGYMSRLGGELHASPEEVITEVTMTSKELAFREVMWLPQEMLPMIAQVVASEAPDMVVGAHDRPVQPRLAAPDPQARLAPMSPRPDPVQYQVPTVEMQSDPFAKMYPAGPVAQFDERSPPPGDQITWPNGQTTVVEAPVEPPKAPRKPRTPKETVIGPGPIPETTFIPPQAANGFVGQTVLTAPPAASFGMQTQPAVPPQDMAAMLSKAFGLKIGS